MQQYTFRVPSEGPVAFLFDTWATDEPSALAKVKNALSEHMYGHESLHVDVSNGLTSGMLYLDPALITEKNIVDIHTLPGSNDPF